MRAARDMHAARLPSLCVGRIWVELHAERRRERAGPVGLARQSDLRDLRAFALVVLRLLLLLLGGPMPADEDTSVKEALLEMLAVERNGVKLNPNLVIMVVGYLVDVVLIKDVSEVDISMVMTVVEDAWADANEGANLPRLHSKAVSKWASKIVGSGGADGLPSGRRFEEDESEDQSKLFGLAGATTRDADLLTRDIDEQGISGTRLLVLSIAIELGRVPSSGEVAGLGSS